LLFRGPLGGRRLRRRDRLAGVNGRNRQTDSERKKTAKLLGRFFFM
jgi:hypothetical protein